MHQSSTVRWTRKNNLSTHRLRALAHGNQTDPAPVRMFREPDSMIFHFQLKRFWQETQTHPRLRGPGVPRHIVEGFLQNAIDMHAGAAIHGKRHALLLIGYGNSGLSFYGRN